MANNVQDESAFLLDGQDLSLTTALDFAFRRRSFPGIKITAEALTRVKKSEAQLESFLKEERPLYGVTTGFGASCSKRLSAEDSTELQANMIRYLLCGTGAQLSKPTSRAVVLLRLHSLLKGFSGVTTELVERMAVFLEKDWSPVIPSQGSLGASGDLVPLAYLAQAIQGYGHLHTSSGISRAEELISMAGLKPYALKPKEGIALVNGTTTMAALSLMNWNAARFFLDLEILETTWLTMALQAPMEYFGELVNQKSRDYEGQRQVASSISAALKEENYSASYRSTEVLFQDRYSLRCTPQVLGPVADTLSLIEDWLKREINSVSDNPLLDGESTPAMGGNFYGGYLSQGMDYLKISLAHMADLMDRQVMLLMDDRSNRGLPHNLVATKVDPHLHHGLKGVHQATSALTSEILALAIPNGIFSRSSESHNQDKVSLGMSAANQCAEMIDRLFTLHTFQLTCLTQALDLRGIRLKGKVSRQIYDLVRGEIPLVEKDQALDTRLSRLKEKLIERASEKGKLWGEGSDVEESTRKV